MTIRDLFQLLIKDYWENIQKKNSLSGLAQNSQWFDALIHFKDYTYERNVTGAISVYKEIAGEVLNELHLKDRERWRNDLELKVWNNFKQKCTERNIKPNEQVDPLKPSNEERKKESLVKFVWDLSTPENKTISAWAFNLLEQNKIREAHQKLKTVWGVGDKIASFYLRDIFWLGHNLNPGTGMVQSNDVYLLQPVDIWVERAAKALGSNRNSKTSIAKFVCSFEKENGLAPGGGNIAFWMLGSNYLDDVDEFEGVLRAISHESENASLQALSIANRFVSFYGKFGQILKEILA